MKVVALLLLLVVGTSAQPNWDEWNAIDVCCDNGCVKACSWIKNNTVIRPHAAVTPKPVSRQLATTPRNDALVNSMCCTTGGSGGDPHFKLWNGEYFDYHGQCDLVLLDAPDFGHGLGLTLHIRTKIRYGYSFIESAALRIGDADVLEVASWGEHVLNGVDSANLLQKHLAAFPIHHEILNRKSQQITVDLGNQQTVVFKTFKDWVSVSFDNATPEDYQTSKGLMGAFFTGLKLARDGITVLQDINVFGQEWQVTADEVGLFQVTDRHPQAPQQCILPEIAAASDSTQRRLGETTVTEEAAKLACQHLDSQAAREMCQYDVLASGDLEFAQAGVF